MIKQALEIFVNAAVREGEITRQDVRHLQRTILPHGPESRDEADVLIALDRAVHERDESWSAFLTQTIVDFVVWGSRPTGHVTRETADWLIRSLGCGTGPSDLAIVVAFEVVREAESCDELLVAFVMRWGGARLRAATPDHADELVF